MSKQRLFTVTIKDCDVQTFRVSGAGGQHRDKTSNGVRVVHRDSGARGESRTERSQAKNKQIAFKRMADSKEFRAWINLQTARLTTDIDKRVEQQLKSANLDIQTGA